MHPCFFTIRRPTLPDGPLSAARWWRLSLQLGLLALIYGLSSLAVALR
jgi:hypothetical protein